MSTLSGERSRGDVRWEQWRDERRRWAASLAVRLHATLVALSTAVVLAVWLGIGLAGNGWHAWPVWPIGGTVLGLAVHALVSTWVVRAIAARPRPPADLP